MEPKSARGNSSKNVQEGATSISVDKLRSSSASSASVVSASSAELSSEDSDDIDRNEHGDFGHDHEQSEKALPKQGPSSSTLESPHVQVMERPPGSSGYRIPSHVFAATSKPGTPHAEWSIASNDSLFSIHNMSFTRDQFNMLLKSGELGMYGDVLKSGEMGKITDLCKSGELPPPLKDALKSLKEQIPAMRPDTCKSGEQLTNTTGTDIGTNNEDPTSEVMNRKGAELSLDQLPCPVTVSRDTETFAPSFAYQVAAKSERSSSVSSATTGAEKPKVTDSSESDQGEQLKENSKTPAEASSSWFSCFSCYSCCGCCRKRSLGCLATQ